MNYEDFVKTTDISNHDLQFYLDGMTEEHGELMGVFKRVRRGDYGKVAKTAMEDPTRGIRWIIEKFPEVKKAIQKELGDYGWYKTRFIQECGWTGELIDSINQRKLTNRKKEGVIMGHGDERENLIDSASNEKQ